MLKFFEFLTRIKGIPAWRAILIFSIQKALAVHPFLGGAFCPVVFCVSGVLQWRINIAQATEFEHAFCQVPMFFFLFFFFLIFNVLNQATLWPNQNNYDLLGCKSHFEWKSLAQIFVLAVQKLQFIVATLAPCQLKNNKPTSSNCRPHFWIHQAPKSPKRNPTDRPMFQRQKQANFV